MRRKIFIALGFSILGAFVFFSCKHKGKEQDGAKKTLMLSSFKVGNNSYDKDAKTILVQKNKLRESDIKAVSFTDGAGNEVQNVNWVMNPPEITVKEGASFKILVTSPPNGYNNFDSGDISAIREFVPPLVTSIEVHGVKADLTKTPYVVRSPKPTVTKPQIFPDGKRYGDITVLFDKDVPEMSIQWDGLPEFEPIAKPEDIAHVTFKVPAKEGVWKEGEYKLDIIFDTPNLAIKNISIDDQDGDVDLKDPLHPKLNLKNTKNALQKTDVHVEWKGEFIEAGELSSVNVEYEGLPLTNLEVSKPQTFKIKVGAKDKVYKAFEAQVTVTRANKPLVLESITVFATPIIDITKLEIDVDTMTCFIKKGDIKAKFKKPDGQSIDVDCLLLGGDKLSLNAGVVTEITFFVPATPEYAEYRSILKVKHNAEWEKMIEIPMPPGGVTWKSGNRDDIDKSFERKFEVAQFPFTYENFIKTCNWALSAEGVAKGYGKTAESKANIELMKQHGQNGAVRNDGDGAWGAGHPVATSGVQPVTSLTYHQCIVLCNMYSEMKGLAPVYYKSSPGIIDIDWGKHPNDVIQGKDWHVYHSLDQKLTFKQGITKEEIDALALRDPLKEQHPNDYKGAAWVNIRNNYVKTVMLTAKQALFGDDSKTGYRLIDSFEWELTARLKLEKTKNTTSSSLTYNGVTYYFADKDSGPGSEGYGDEGSEIEKVAWVNKNSRVAGILQTHPIGHRRPTDLCFYDLAGNAGSWTNSWSKSNGADGEEANDYTNYYVGCAFSDEAYRAVVNRLGPSSNGRFDGCGLRLVRTLE